MCALGMAIAPFPASNEAIGAAPSPASRSHLHEISGVEEAVGKADLLDTKTKLEKVHGNGEEHDADGGRFWAPVVFPSYAALQRQILAGKD